MDLIACKVEKTQLLHVLDLLRDYLEAVLIEVQKLKLLG